MGPALLQQLGVWAIIGTALVLLFGDRWRTRPSLVHLSEDTRRALYEARMEAFRLQCIPLQDALASACRHDADLLRHLPECDDACRTLLTHSARTAIR